MFLKHEEICRFEKSDDSEILLYDGKTVRRRSFDGFEDAINAGPGLLEGGLDFLFSLVHKNDVGGYSSNQVRIPVVEVYESYTRKGTVSKG